MNVPRGTLLLVFGALFVAGATVGAFLEARVPVDLSRVDWTAVATGIVALGTLGLAWQTRATVREVQADRYERHQAFVIAYAEVQGGDIAVVVENRGPGPAFNVSVTAVAPGGWLEAGDSGNRLPIAIGYMPGGMKMPWTFDVWTMDPNIAARFPASRVLTRWLDEHRREHATESIIDPGPWLVWRPSTGSLHEIAEAIRNKR